MHVVMVAALPADRTKPAGGPTVTAACLIRELVRQGTRVTAVEWGAQGHRAHHDDHLNCEVIPLPLHRPAILGNALHNAREVRDIVEDLQPDVVHVQAVAELGRLVRRPSVLTVRGIPYRDEWLLKGPRRYITAPVMALTFHRSVRRYDHLISISPYTRQVVRLPDAVCVHDIPNPAEQQFFDVKRENVRPVVLTVGILSELKNTLGVVQTAAKVRQAVPDVQFRIAGPWRSTSADYRRRVEAYWQQEGLQQTARFLGHLGREALMAEMASASCLLLPSFQENSPVVIAEAMASGVPVTASRICGIPFLVEDGKTGLLFDPRDPDQIVDCVTRLLTDQGSCEGMGRAAREDAWRRFRIEVVAQRHLEVYQQAAEKRSG